MNKTEERMKVRTTESVLRKNIRGSAKNWKYIFINFGGVFSAFGIAFGGLFLVQSRLVREEAELLQGSGKVEVIGESEVMDASEVQVSDTIVVEKALLTEEELTEAVENLARGGEEYPHEPRQGQLTMAQAIESGKEWLEDFLKPHLGMEETGLGEYKANCYLWTSQGDKIAGEGKEQDKRFSYWTVILAGQGMEAELILNAVSGQVLEASVASACSIECWDEERRNTLLQDYGDSFGLEGSSMFLDGRNGVIYRSIGSRGLYTAVGVESVLISRVEADGAESEELFRVHLYLLMMD